MQCPVDQSVLEQKGKMFACAMCHGRWVAEDVLVAMLEASQSALVELPWLARDGSHVPCAECGKAMETVTLGQVALDRCATHGVWFDARELEEVFEHGKELRSGIHALPPIEPEEHHDGLLRRLVHLIKR